MEKGSEPLIEDRNFYEEEAQSKRFWGSTREIALSENVARNIPLKATKTIDIGCGDGFLLFNVTKRIKGDIYALDLAKKRLENVKRCVPDITTIQGDVSDLPFKDNIFDVVICSEVLEHVPKYKEAIRELIRIAKQAVIISVPNDQELIKTLCPRCKKYHYLSGHRNRFTKDSLIELFSQYSDAGIEKVVTFHTIFTYNRISMKLPVGLRIFFDSLLIKFQRFFSFLKPNFLLIRVKKI